LNKKLIAAALLACLAPGAPVVTRAQSADGPEAVARDFYEWYTGRLDSEDFSPLKRRREALRYLTPEFHRRAPRIIADEMVDIFICAQDWQPGWGDDIKFYAGPVRGSRAQVTATFNYGPESQASVRLTLRRAAGRWRIDGADCLGPSGDPAP